MENWDEAFYGQATKEMIATKNFIVLHWNYEIWLEKPPMYIWLTSLSSLIFGLSEFAIRLPSAISAFIIIFLATAYSYKKYSLLPAAITFLTLVLNNVFIWRSRSGNIDLFASLLILLTFFVLISKSKYKYLLLGFLFFCIYMTKASLVEFPLLIFILNEIYEKKNILKAWKEYLKLFIVFIGLSSIWLLLGFLQAGTAFLASYTIHADQGAASFSIFNANYLRYAYYALQRRFFFVFLLGIVFALWNIKKREYFLLFLYSTILLIQLSFTTRDNNWYLIPSMPFWSILIGFATYSILNLVKNKRILLLGTSFVIVTVSFYLFYRTFSINILPILNSSSVIDQANSAKTISTLTKPNDIVIRLSPLAPTTLYYDNRKTLAYSPTLDTSTHGYWISKDDLTTKLNSKQIQWLVGTNNDVNDFFKFFNDSDFEKIPVGSQEVILKLK